MGLAPLAAISRALPLSSALLGFGLLLGLESSAAAQLLRERPGTSIAFEAKVGPYLPDIAKEGTSAVWDAVYGDDRTRALVMLGFDFQMLRGDAGTLSLGVHAGFVHWDGGVTTDDGTSIETSFDVVPLTLTLGYRFDALVDYTWLPIAPYVRGGYAHYVYWNEGPPLGEAGAGIDGNGSKSGLTATAGLAVALDGFDPLAAAQLADQTGIATTYLFFEGQMAWVDGFGDGGIDLSDTTWFGGLMLEL